MSDSRSYITRSSPGTFAGKRIAALIPAIPAPTTMTFILGAMSMGWSSISSGCHVTLSVAATSGAGWESELPMLQAAASSSFSLRLAFELNFRYPACGEEKKQGIQM